MELNLSEITNGNNLNTFIRISSHDEKKIYVSLPYNMHSDNLKNRQNICAATTKFIDVHIDL